jgi:hypothetical protein
VNLKSPSDGTRPENAAASRGSGDAGVNSKSGLRLKEIAAGRFFESFAANAGDSKRAAAPSAPATFAALKYPNFTSANSLFVSRYRLAKLKVP